MPSIRLCCITFIFLSALFSARSQDRSEWLRRAVELERTVFQGGSAVEVNEALVAKADCYREAGEWEAAVATLERVRMYALSPESRDSVIFRKELCYYNAGRPEDAAACIEEYGEGGGRDPEALMLHSRVLTSLGRYEGAKRKSPEKAYMLGMLPPAGHIYAGKPAEGALSFVMNASVIAAAVWQVCGGFYITGILGGAIALERTWRGSSERAMELAEEYNAEAALDSSPLNFVE